MILQAASERSVIESRMTRMLILMRPSRQEASHSSLMIKLKRLVAGPVIGTCIEELMWSTIRSTRPEDHSQLSAVFTWPCDTPCNSPRTVPWKVTRPQRYSTSPPQAPHQSHRENMRCDIINQSAFKQKNCRQTNMVSFFSADVFPCWVEY
jgi:hypothetical protein